MHIPQVVTCRDGLYMEDVDCEENKGRRRQCHIPEDFYSEAIFLMKYGGSTTATIANKAI